MSVKGFRTGSGVERYDFDSLDNKPSVPTAQDSDIGKFLKVKSVLSGKVTEYEFGEGSNGTKDYSKLENKPSINGVLLDGNKTSEDLNLAGKDDIKEAPVQSVNGETGTVILDSDDIGFESSKTYKAGTIGSEIAAIKPKATSSDIGKAIIVKSIDSETGIPSEYEYGDAGGIETVHAEDVIVKAELIEVTPSYSDRMIKLTASSTVNGYVWNADSKTAIPTSNYHYSRFDNIGIYKKLYISGIDPTNGDFADFYDSNDAFVDRSWHTNTRTGFVGISVTVPDGASYVIVNGSSESNFDLPATVYALIPGTHELDGFETLSGVMTEKVAWRRTGQNLPSGNNYCWTKYETIPDVDRLYVSGYSWGDNYPLISFYNSSDSMLDYYGKTGTTLYENIEVEIPSGTAYFCVNGHFTKEHTIVQYPEVKYLPRSYEESVTRTQADVNKKIDKKYLFIGDSYGEGYSHDGNNSGWITYAAQYMGLSADDFIKKYTGGYNFSSGTFQRLMETVDDPDVTDVVVCGGYNDRNATEAQILNGITNFKNSAEQKWSGVTVHVGFVAYNKEGSGSGAIAEWETIRSALLSVVLPAYQKSITVGCEYLNNVEYWLNEEGLTNSDGYHPSALGNSRIGMAVANALLTGSAPLPYHDDLRLT